MKTEKSDLTSSPSFPSSEQIENELSRTKHEKRKPKPFRTAVIIFIVTAAVVVIINATLFPIMQAQGSAMGPAISNGEILLTFKLGSLNRGDVCCYYNNSVLQQSRIIALGGEEVNIDKDGRVYINNTPYVEGYISEFALGEGDIAFPFKVPENTYFVLNDNRFNSMDSRNSKVGCITKAQVVSKVIFKLMPPGRINK